MTETPDSQNHTTPTMKWELTGTRGTSHRGTEPVRLTWADGVLEGPEVLVDEWRRLCDHYAGGSFFITSGEPLRMTSVPARDPIVSFLIAVNWLPIWVDEVSWEPALPAELEDWQPKPRNVLPLAMVRLAPNRSLKPR
jgi:hypothetical protein